MDRGQTGIHRIFSIYSIKTIKTHSRLKLKVTQMHNNVICTRIAIKLPVVVVRFCVHHQTYTIDHDSKQTGTDKIRQMHDLI